MAPPWVLSFDEAAVRDDGGALRDVLREYGFVRVTGVVPPAACADLSESLRSFVTSLGFGGRYGDTASVADPSLWPPDCSTGIFGSFGAGHAEAAWRGRTHARVLALQAAYWGTTRLVTSCDGVNAELPQMEPQRRSDAATQRWHLDENRYAPGAAHAAQAGDELECIQGVLSLTATTVDGGGTSVIKGSHRRCVADALFPRGHPLCAEKKHTFYVLKPGELQRLKAMPGCELVHVETDAGDVVLFSSLAVHCGRRARAPTTDADAWRFALYSTCVPAWRLSDGDRAQKRRALGLAPWPNGVTRAETTNHPPDGSSIKSRGRRSPNGSIGIAQAPPWVLGSPQLLRLAGALPYDDSEQLGAAAAAAGVAAPRLGSAKRGVPETDLEQQREARLKRFAAGTGAAGVMPSASAAAAAAASSSPEVLVIDDADVIVIDD